MHLWGNCFHSQHRHRLQVGCRSLAKRQILLQAQELEGLQSSGPELGLEHLPRTQREAFLAKVQWKEVGPPSWGLPKEA